MSARVWADGRFVDDDQEMELLRQKCAAALSLASSYEEENRRLRERIGRCLNELANDVELKRYDAFVARHNECRRMSKSRNNWPYVRQYGAVTKVYCPVCGAVENISYLEDGE